VIDYRVTAVGRYRNVLAISTFSSIYSVVITDNFENMHKLSYTYNL